MARPDHPAGHGAMKAPLVAAALLGVALTASAAPPDMLTGAPHETGNLVKPVGNPDTLLAVLTGGNGIYTIYVENASFYCGTWTATTAAAHPAGPGLNVLYGNGSPATSYTTLRVYTGGTHDYVTGSSGGGTGLCGTVAPVVTPILNGAVTVGYSFVWTFLDGPSGNTLVFTQDVQVVGPVDGTETVDNTAICETHTVENLGPGSVDFGVRKQWDYQIGFDDGPYFGDCATPTEACDVSINLGPADQPQSYIINEDPAIVSCPAPIVPVGPNCGGAPIYIVAGTVNPPSNLVPPPDPPELLQFNSWPSLFSTTWQPALVNNATCGDGDTAIAYFYGLTAATAESLGSGQSQTFTQYVVAGEETCPEVVQPAGAKLDIKPGSCPNSWNRGSNGVLPVAVVSTDTFDATMIDPSTVEIRRADGMGGSATPHEGPPGPHTTVDDTATPFDGELCACHELTGDGLADLNLKFKTQEVVAALDMDEFDPGALVELVVSGMLMDGTPFEASDCVRLVPPGSPPGALMVNSNAADAWIDLTPLDNQLEGGGFANFERVFPVGTFVLLTASPSQDGRKFLRWESDQPVFLLDAHTLLAFVYDDTHTVTAIYEQSAPSLRRWGGPWTGLPAGD